MTWNKRGFNVIPFLLYSNLYRKSGYSRKFFEAHRAEIILHREAKSAFDQLGVKKLPKVKDLTAEYAQVLAEKKSIYAEYRAARSGMQEYQKARHNVEVFFEIQQKQEEQVRREHLALDR